MSDFNRGYPGPATAGPADMAVDAGLRGFMLGVYNKVALGLVLSAALAYVTSTVPAARDLLFRTVDGQLAGLTIIGWVVALAPLGVLMIGRMAFAQTARSSGVMYWLIVALFGASLGDIGLLYRLDSIASTFLITATAFGALSLFGYATKRDLSPMLSFLVIGLVGILIAMVVNAFIQSTAMAFIVNVIGVLVFAGFTAYDTQKLKMTYYQLGGNQTSMAVATNYGALNLYLDFLNMFLFLLRLTGGRR